MKKIISALFLCMLLSAVPELQAQNIQLHYDFGRSLYDKDLKGRPLLTSTVEKFHPDNWGSTYFFIDMDYTSEGVASAYWEIARELKFWKGPFSAHLEYNGGLAKEFSYNNAYLAGATYTYNNASFSRGFTLTAMYKYIQKHPSPNNFQLTGTWYMSFLVFSFARLICSFHKSHLHFFFIILYKLSIALKLYIKTLSKSIIH